MKPRRGPPLRHGILVAGSLAALAASCSRGGFAPPPEDLARGDAPKDRALQPEARPGDRSPGDRAPAVEAAGTDQGRVCSWTGSFTFTAPVPLTVLNSSVQDGNPFVTPDGQTIYFESKRAGGPGKEDIWRARRSPSGGWGAPALVPGINTAGSESAYSETADGLTAFLSAGWAGGAGGWDIWMITRSSTAEPFDPAAAIPVTAVNDALLQWDPMPAANGLRLYLASQDYPGGLGSTEVVVSTRATPNSPFGAPVPVPGVNSSASDANPSLTADLRVILLASNRTGGSGGYDLWYAVADGAGYATPAPLPALNSASNDMEPFVTPDGCELYFASDRPGGLGDWDLYHASYVGP